MVHWEGSPADWRVHLITEHCQFGKYSCNSLAAHTVSFGFFADDDKRVPVGAPMGVCDEHLRIVEMPRVSVQVSPPTS